MHQSKCRSRDDAASKEPFNFSSSGVQLMASMDETPVSCAADNSYPMAAYRKPGYTLDSYVASFTKTDAGLVPIIKPVPGKKDVFSTLLVRCGFFRYSYTVNPGIYGIGAPDKDSEVLVTANFKLTFDHLREALKTVNAWILVLDTKGINVWCAAGKGTFSTQELVRQIQRTSLDHVVKHKRVIVPQLGATGVCAKQVKKASGFSVIYGPIRAKDIPDFLYNGKKADKKMRQVTFSLYERFILTPVELQNFFKPALLTIPILVILSGLGPGIFSFAGAWERGSLTIIALVAGIISGAFITPLLLPYIPFREFALKGILAGSCVMILLLFFTSLSMDAISGNLALFLFSVAISSFSAMNFTGTTPYTSPSGVEKEMKRYIPVQLASLVVSAGLWFYSAFN